MKLEKSNKIKMVFGIEYQIYEKLQLSGFTEINFNIYVEGNLNCEGNLKIRDNICLKYINIGKIGSRNSDTIFYIFQNDIFITCGCFRDYINQFKKAVLETHDTNNFSKEYFIFIKAVEKLAKIYI
jgi:hypothetical protein